MKKILKWGGIILLILIVLGVIGSLGKSGTQKTAETTTSPVATNEPKPTEAKPKEQVAGLNQSVTDGDLTFTVLNVKKQKTIGNQYTQKSAQGMYYLVTLKLENTGKQTKTFDSSMAKVTDDQEREYDRSIDGQTALVMSQGKVDLFLQQIQPGLSYTGDLVFDLPENISNPVLVVKSSLFGQGAKISLQ